MNYTTVQPVVLNVHLEGAIAYAKDDNARLWSLIPEALVPVRARWRIAKKDPAFYARAPHLALLLADYDTVNHHTTSRAVASVIQKYEDYVTVGKAQAVIPLLRQQLDFVLPDGQVTIAPEVEDHYPHMARISGRHTKIARVFKPSPGGVIPNGLSCAFQMKGGNLKVERYFGPVHSPRPLDFAYVFPILGKLHYFKRQHFDKVANKLVWSVPLPLGERSVKINASVKLNGQTEHREYIFDVPRDKGVINLRIMHGEAEVPFLFREDPHIPREIQKLPDPDFEMIYGLSSSMWKWLPWRVPVPQPGVKGDGGVEKPCIGGISGGFA
jgi:hypothetical protein